MNDDTPVKYCTKCGSLNVSEGAKMRCMECNAGPDKIDVTLFGKYVLWHIRTLGTDPTAPPPTIYDDIEETFNEEAEAVITEHEALQNGMNVGNWLQRDLRRYDR